MINRLESIRAVADRDIDAVWPTTEQRSRRRATRLGGCVTPHPDLPAMLAAKQAEVARMLEFPPEETQTQ